LPGVTYSTFGKWTFAQAPAPSLLPTILTKLRVLRKKAKKDMWLARGTPLEKVYDGKQLAFKVSMNSVYGFTGATKGMLPLVAIAETVTMEGRNMIEKTKNHVEAEYPGAKVRYGDTDSVMVEFDVQGRTGQEAIDYSWLQGTLAAQSATKLFRAPNNLVIEKVYCPYYLYSKKRYMGNMYVENDQKEVRFKKIDVKGLQVVRRDSCPFVRATLKSLMGLLMSSSDPRPILEEARSAGRDLLTGKVPMAQLLLSKQLGSDYKVPMPHVAVRDKMKAREPGSEPQQGDRVSFVLVDRPGKMYEKAEDPEHVQRQALKIDYKYYYENQFKKPVCDLLEPLIGRQYIFDKKLPADEMGARRQFLDVYKKLITSQSS
jgi:DNA polymerase delta subunit 1